MVSKKILVCCGTGIATSVQVANKLQKLLKDRGVNTTMKECKAVEVPAQTAAFKPDAIVSTTVVKSPSADVKVYRGVAFLTGVGADKLADQIAEDLKG
ncbi:PTS galactitol transporter subunit IIB [Acidipropionibacterium acidipropionici]|uniref:PTS galactitol transporter subunit IIB n=2 Tax=Acidipropionibacterium acidipropionici TaxID=1748 RepID=A0AAC8YGX5_9ACTN|nr:PTS sugar transporter subunit IIB [Acidipropionibacterium acidipropionici]AFV88652.1 PTS system, Lactose/Cellobiose specific IIB subunit [Acidipropionibacterium acidipropionici ATCC 4875]AMS06365.1 PTS galactitol transporter subunit IIB [Acidipropionibacterium acidipropionici]AOZ47816.1 PTS galactitol transporter subunit IIB [Acidipropionibacterium acidipropionici]AZP38841.1 PTS galactitol transporter subunit IIB [Acidipropionibacterium acidipropionici]QCV95803.1 PTS galactitol transporter 